jgi:hypothetical protein
MGNLALLQIRLGSEAVRLPAATPAAPAAVQSSSTDTAPLLFMNASVEFEADRSMADRATALNHCLFRE